MELEVKRNSSMSSMIAASVLITLITLSTLTIGGIATPAAAQQGGTPGTSSNRSMWTSSKRCSKSNCKS